MHWFSHWRRTGGRHNCITYLLTDVLAWPTATLATPTSVCWFFCVVTQQTATFWGVGTQGGVCDPEIRTRARFLYNAPNCQLSSSYVNRSEVIVLTNKQTNWRTKRRRWKTSSSLCYAAPVGIYEKLGLKLETRIQVKNACRSLLTKFLLTGSNTTN